MGEGDIADAAVVEVLHGRQIILDRGAVFDAHRQGEDPFGEEGTHLVNGASNRERVGRLCRDTLDEVDEFVRQLPPAASLLQRRRHVDRHEGGIETALPGAYQVEMTVLRANSDIVGLFQQPVGEVDMGVNRQSLLREAYRLGTEIGLRSHLILGLLAPNREHYDRQQCRQKTAFQVHVAFLRRGSVLLPSRKQEPSWSSFLRC